MRVLVLRFAVPDEVAAKWDRTVPVSTTVCLEAGGAEIRPFDGWLEGWHYDDLDLQPVEVQP